MANIHDLPMETLAYLFEYVPALETARMATLGDTHINSAIGLARDADSLAELMFELEVAHKNGVWGCRPGTLLDYVLAMPVGMW